MLSCFAVCFTAIPFALEVFSDTVLAPVKGLKLTYHDITFWNRFAQLFSAEKTTPKPVFDYKARVFPKELYLVEIYANTVREKKLVLEINFDPPNA